MIYQTAHVSGKEKEKEKGDFLTVANFTDHVNLLALKVLSVN